MAFDLDHAYRLDPAVSLREEPFGALAYNHATRRLSFLRSPALVRVLKQIELEPSARRALERAGGEDGGGPAIEKALATLFAQGVIRAR